MPPPQVYVIITIFLTGFIYPVVVHWGWSGDGWASAFAGDKRDLLFGVGVVDFAGSGIVHMVGGVAAFVAAVFIGPRHGRFVKHYKLNDRWYARTVDQPLVEMTDLKWMEIVEDADSPSGETWKGASTDAIRELDTRFHGAGADALETRTRQNNFPAQSSTFATLGCMILWFGWYGFNCASTLGISGGYSGIAAKVAVTTTLAAAGGAITAGALTSMLEGLQDLSAMSNGILAGLVSITAPCSATEPWAALVIGCIGGVVYYFAVKLLDKLGVDDVVLAIPVHCFCGIWGVISVGIFASPHAMGVAYGSGGCGIIYSGHDGCTNAGDQLMAQLVFVGAIIGWVVATMSLLLFVTKLVLGQLTGFVETDGHKTPLAYTAAQQMEGMDRMKHGGMTGSENTTVYTPRESEPRLNSPQKVGVEKSVRRTSVVGQKILPPADLAGP